MDLMQIYNHLPIWGQNLACFYEGSRIKRTRFGKIFWQKLAEYEERDAWTYEQRCEYRDAQLRKMVMHCYDTVPYYNRLFKEYKINPKEICTLCDLKRLPVLTKNQIKNNITDFLSNSISKNKTKIHPTGGTTGSGLRFVTNNSEESEQWAVWWRYRIRNGINMGTLCGVFGGKIIVPIKQQKPPFWRLNYLCNQVYFSGYHITPENAPCYAKYIQDKAIKWLHGYPSIIANLASYLVEKNIIIPMEFVSIGAENLYPWQSEIIEKAFCVKPIQHYGLTEGVANISEIPGGELVVDEDFSCVEFLKTTDGFSKIIGTTLTNYSMPLLRYDTGDLAIISNEVKHNQFGRIVQSLNGRCNEFVSLPNGTTVGAAAISLILNDFPEIQSSQIVQDRIDSIIVKVIEIEGKRINNEKLLYKLQERFGHKINIKILKVEKLEKTKNGKQKLVISNI